MRSKVLEDADVVTYAVVCDPGDEAVAALEEFARAERLEASQIGDVAEDRDGPSLNVHVVPGLPDGRYVVATSSRHECSRRWRMS